MRITRSDTEIAENIRFNLYWDNWVDSANVDIDVTNEVVTLKGEADSFLEKRAASDDAADALGVIDVINNIRVEPV